MTYDIQADSDFHAISEDVTRADGSLMDAWIMHEGERWYPFIAKDRKLGVRGFDVNFSGEWKTNEKAGRQKLSIDKLLTSLAEDSFPRRSTIRCKTTGGSNGNGRKLSRIEYSPRLQKLIARLRDQRGPDSTIDDEKSTKIDSSSHSSDGVVDSSSGGKRRPISDADYLDILNRQRENGAAGERIVIDWERGRLIDCGCSAPEDFVTHTSKKNVGAGFDIHSHWTADHERFIEVKTTASGADYFFMSENEKQVLTDKADKAYVYIVDLDSSGKDTGTVRVPIKLVEAELEFEPVAYRVRLKQ